jgi:hypothetical protein
MGLSVVPVRAEGLPAWLAAGRMPIPTFAEIHRAFTRICANESGFKSLADQDGILQSLLYAGGGRREGRTLRGQGYGLDYRKLMKRMARHSRRTFPTDSKFLMMSGKQRMLLARRQTRQNKWTSTMQLDCSQPEGWPELKKDGSRRMDPWKSHYGKRCQVLVETTRAFLKGRIKSYCDGRPTTWGSKPDIYRPGGAHDEGWLEIHCDRPNPDNPDEDCDELEKPDLLNSTTCARNHFWTWLKTAKEKE